MSTLWPGLMASRWISSVFEPYSRAYSTVIVSAGSLPSLRTGTSPAFSQSEMMIVAAARELAGQHVCFVGVGLPNIAVNLAQRTVAPDLELVYEAGVFGARPARLPLSIGDPTIVTGATAATSMFELFAFYLQGGLIDAVLDEGDVTARAAGFLDDDLDFPEPLFDVVIFSWSL